MSAALDIPALADVDAELRLRGLAHYVSHLSPQYAPPHHLAPLLRRFELAVDGVPQRVCCSAPPRHGKTESALHVVPFALRRRPQLRFGYFAYGASLARKKSRACRAMMERAQLATVGNVYDWHTPEGGGLLSGGVGGPLTGSGLDVLLVDDPTKNRLEAESATYRERLLDWWRDVARTRLEPGGSVFVFATRWTEDDLIGTLVREGFENLNLPALSEDGVALWPQRYDVAALNGIRREVGEYTWASLYQGQPRPRGGRVFEGVTTYSALPTSYRAAQGIDGAYTAKKSSDYSARVRMVRDAEGIAYVVDARRAQVRSDVWHRECAQEALLHPGDTWRWYVSTTEQGVAHLMAGAPVDVVGEERLPGVPVNAQLARGDKFTRAQAYAAAWNAGRVRVPERGPWLQHFIAEHAGFTGAEGGVDDVVDAAVAAWDELQQGGERISHTLTPAPNFSALRSTRM